MSPTRNILTQIPVDRQRIKTYAAQFLAAPIDTTGPQTVTQRERDLISSLEDVGCSYLGHGLTRHVFLLPTDSRTRDYVLKLPRTHDHETQIYEATGQNRAERRVTEQLQTDPPDIILPDWFAQVHLTGSTVAQTGNKHQETYHDAWLIMDYHPTLRDCYPQAEHDQLTQVAHAFFNLFSNTPLSPEYPHQNIGLNITETDDVPPITTVQDTPREWCLYIDYGNPNWTGKQLATPENTP